MTAPSPSPRRVLFMVQELTQGGSERQCATTAMGLHRRGWTVQVATMRPGGMRAAELASAGIPLPVFPIGSFASTDPLTSGLRFWRHLRRHRIDAVLAFDLPSNIFAVPWARLAGTPLVLASQRAHRDLTPPWLRPGQKLSDRLAHKIVVNCQSLQNELQNDYGLAAAKLELVYNGIDTDTFQPSGARASLPFPENAITVGVVCALRPEKDLHTLLKGFAMVAPDYPLAHLLIVGDGPERRALEGEALAGRVHFAGAQTDTSPWYRAIDVFVLPSLSEGLSNSLLEAMACGCIALASSTGGNPEITRKLFPPGDAQALAELLRGELQKHSQQREKRSSLLPAAFEVSAMIDRMAVVLGGG